MLIHLNVLQLVRVRLSFDKAQTRINFVFFHVSGLPAVITLSCVRRVDLSEFMKIVNCASSDGVQRCMSCDKRGRYSDTCVPGSDVARHHRLLWARG